MMRASPLAAAALIPSLPAPTRAASPQEPFPKSATGKVGAVGDGDTITVLLGKTHAKAHLAAVDCPQGGPGEGRPSRSCGG